MRRSARSASLTELKSRHAKPQIGLHGGFLIRRQSHAALYGMVEPEAAVSRFKPARLL
jgi:hypothetical protein